MLEGALILVRILVTSAWPYINVTPHLGNLVGSVLSADVVARYYRLKGDDVLMVSGSDEHGTPIEVEALRQGIAPKELTDKNHAYVTDLFKRWGASFDNYTRTESSVHKEFVQSLLLRIYERGYIFSEETRMLFCEKDKRFLPDRFVEGKCPYCEFERARGDQCDRCGRLLETSSLLEPYCVLCGNKPVLKNTKHWYIDLSRLAKPLSDYLQNNKELPANAKNFSLNWIKEGLRARAVTRDVEWGIPAPFPGATGKTIYVWVEAVLGYISATVEYYKRVGKPQLWREFWFNEEAKTLFFVGKDNIPFHTIILPALLLASGEGYNLPWKVSATEFLQFKGEKASKSRRVGIWIDEALELFPVDYWRFFLIATRPEAKDTNFSWDFFVDKINADLNDTFGNFIHRTLTFINARFNGEVPPAGKLSADENAVMESIREKINIISEEFEKSKLQSAANTLISLSRAGNQYLNEKEPWNLLKSDRSKAETVLYTAIQVVKALTVISTPILPNTAEQLWKTLNLSGGIHECRWSEASKPLDSGHRIDKPSPLFRKIDASADQLDELLLKAREKIANAK